MPFKNILPLLIVVCFLSACGKKQTPSPGQQKSTTPVDIYMAGAQLTSTGNYVATYWKNGIAFRLADSSSASSAVAISVSGSNVAVTGDATINGKETQVYWKNGVMTPLSTYEGAIAFSAHNVAISGDDVYVVGESNENASGQASYWKNGVFTTFPVISDLSFAQSIYINGSDIYIAGTTIKNFANYATIWKNGVPTVFPNIDSRANDVVVSGNDVYIAGYIGTSAAYWKNGVAYTVQPDNTISSTMANSIAVSGNNVYLTGISVLLNSTVNTNAIATCWKNGVATYITPKIAIQSNSYGSEGQAIEVNSGDIYVAGWFLNNYNCYWENGKLVPLTGTSATTTVNSMTIAPR
ncbi:hypothetical protein HDF18_20100 [Mucilaginibacter sp. X5P1]|uniref:hypothetical protein n=1 Tax=Mucilaginibacter sp. X5P1 TaxID=2723088 RepID=UPI00161B2535|nr:hypothetical protein [Mucilaginibacter sp. X5P1]MBB6142004.1 hypothetical protein [Mucilaginibacter sp. X5P1]